MNEKRRIIMKTKRNILGALVAGTLLAASGSASAVTVWDWSGTLANWTTAVPGGDGNVIYDGYFYTNNPATPVAPNGGNAGTTSVNTANPDVTFTYISNTTAVPTNITMREDHVGGNAFYNIGLNWSAAQNAGSFVYAMTTSDVGHGFNAASLDTVVSASSGDVTKQVYDYTGNVVGALLLTINSTTGVRTPAAGWDPLAPSLAVGYSSVYIVDTINTITGGGVTSIFNEVTTVPEPATLALLGIGLLGVFGLRRKSAVENSSSMTYC